jgi:ABC-type uncharacterized transport system substrate-binding protein
MKRREVITILAGAAAWPLAARAQQVERMRRVGVLMNATKEDPHVSARFAAFLQGMQQLGWTEGLNVRIDVRWGTLGDTVDRYRKDAAELIAPAPDVILGTTTPSMEALQQATGTVPIVFAMIVDPAGQDFIESLARPGGNITGFMQFEYSLAGKWLELLRQISPRVTRAAVLRDPANRSGIGQFAVIQAVAPQLGMEVVAVNVRDAAEIERRITAFGSAPNSGLVMTGGAGTAHRELIFRLAERHRLPSVYPYRYHVVDGGLISYGPDLPGLFRQAAGYVDRILKGETPSNLPVQAPTKYELVINLKAAKAIGLVVPPSLVARADEVIE